MALRAVTWDVWERNQLSKYFPKYIFPGYSCPGRSIKKPQHFDLTSFSIFCTFVGKFHEYVKWEIYENGRIDKIHSMKQIYPPRMI